MIFLSCWPDLHSSCPPLPYLPMMGVALWPVFQVGQLSVYIDKEDVQEAINDFSPLKKNLNKNGTLIMLNFIHTSIQRCVVQATGEVLAALVLHKCAQCLNLANLSDRKNEDILIRQIVPKRPLVLPYTEILRSSSTGVVQGLYTSGHSGSTV